MELINPCDIEVTIVSLGISSEAARSALEYEKSVSIQNNETSCPDIVLEFAKSFQDKGFNLTTKDFESLIDTYYYCIKNGEEERIPERSEVMTYIMDCFKSLYSECGSDCIDMLHSFVVKKNAPLQNADN
ncbi:MAG: hypothetical protein N2749_01415 [Clostridia bacterium]|nr:hypothetical protein [Clostridia bacterium]